MEIQRQRVLHGLTQDKLGEAMGYSKQTISAWENGRLTPSEEAYENLRSILHVAPESKICSSMEEKKMCLSIKPLEDLKSEKEVENAIEQILNTLSLNENQHIIKYVLKRLMFVGVAETLSYNRIGKMHNHKMIRDYSWKMTIFCISSGLFLENACHKYNNEAYVSTALVLKDMLDEKMDLLMYGCHGPQDNWWKIDNPDDIEEQIPLKGDDWEIEAKGITCLYELLDVLPENDNSIITSVLVYLKDIESLINEMEG